MPSREEQRARTRREKSIDLYVRCAADDLATDYSPRLTQVEALRLVDLAKKTNDQSRVSSFVEMVVTRWPRSPYNR